jgi:antimicrobial peptide system SdpB family protein
VYRRFTGWGTYLLIRIQIAAIYFHSAAGKVTVEEWRNGTAIYYWFTDPAFGVPPWIASGLLPMLESGIVVTAITWGTVLLELFLFAGLVMDKRGWPYLLWLGIALHVGIALLIGLPAFSTAMIGVLILYLRPLEQRFQFESFRFIIFKRLDTLGNFFEGWSAQSHKEPSDLI